MWLRKVDKADSVKFKSAFWPSASVGKCDRLGGKVGKGFVLEAAESRTHYLLSKYGTVLPWDGIQLLVLVSGSSFRARV